MTQMAEAFTRALTVAITILLLWMPPAAWAEAQTVLLVPFTIFSENELSFLQKGIQSMLATRLQRDGALDVIEVAPEDPALKDLSDGVDDAAAAALADRFETDFVAFGTVTILGESISTDAKLFEAATGETRVAFSAAGKSQGDAILHVNAFAEEANNSLFGTGSTSVATGAVQPAPPQAGGQVPDAASRANPEALYRRELGVGISEVPTGSEPAALLWKSGNFKDRIHAIAVGDVDGDQKVEVVMAGRETIYVYRMEAGGGMQRVSEIPLDHWVTVFGVDTADLNGNGIEELFISARDDKFRPDSFVMEWDGAQFATIEKNSRWYFRAVPDPVSGERVLYGQQGGLRDPLFGAVYAMGWSDGRYSPQEKQFVPNQSTVFGFATGDVLHTGEPVVVSFVKGEKLRITMPNGREEWTSADRYGGRSDYLVPSEEYVQLQRESRANPDPEPMSRDWLAQRVIIDDVNGDGKQEVLVVMNHDQTGGVFERLRSFTKGRFECLQWDNIGLQPLWRTRYFTGYISDYDYADPNNDGQKELIFCVVKEIGDPITGSKISYLVVWKPEQAAAAPPTPAPASQ